MPLWSSPLATASRVQNCKSWQDQRGTLKYQQRNVGIVLRPYSNPYEGEPKVTKSLEPIRISFDGLLGCVDGSGVEQEGVKLEDVWWEDSTLGKRLSAVHTLFGNSVQPYTPGAAIEQIFF